MTRKIASVFMFLTLLVGGFTSAQIVTPVKWTWRAEPIVNSPSEYKLIFTATVDKKWHTYSQYIKEGGPVATKISFEKNGDIQLEGKTTETGGKVFDGHDPVFNMQIKYFEEKMVCEQKVKVLKDTKLKGTVEFMACDDSRCLPPDEIDFEFALKPGHK